MIVYFEKMYESIKVNIFDIGMFGNKDTGNVTWHWSQREPPQSEEIWQLWAAVIITLRKETGLVMPVSVSRMKLLLTILLPLSVSSLYCSKDCRPDTTCCSESVCVNNPADDNGFGECQEPVLQMQAGKDNSAMQWIPHFLCLPFLSALCMFRILLWITWIWNSYFVLKPVSPSF